MKIVYEAFNGIKSHDKQEIEKYETDMARNIYRYVVGKDPISDEQVEFVIKNLEALKGLFKTY